MFREISNLVLIVGIALSVVGCATTATPCLQ